MNHHKRDEMSTLADGSKSMDDDEASGCAPCEAAG